VGLCGRGAVGWGCNTILTLFRNLVVGLPGGGVDDCGKEALCVDEDCVGVGDVGGDCVIDGVAGGIAVEVVESVVVVSGDSECVVVVVDGEGVGVVNGEGDVDACVVVVSGNSDRVVVVDGEGVGVVKGEGDFDADCVVVDGVGVVKGEGKIDVD
jgi:hypothetical protein